MPWEPGEKSPRRLDYAPWISPLPNPVLSNARVLDQQVHSRECEDLAIGRLQEPPHVLVADLEAAPCDAGNHVVALAAFIAQRAQALHARNLVASRAVVFRELGLDQGHRVELIGNDEVRGLVETVDTLGALGLAEADLGSGENVLDRALDQFPDDFTNSIAMAFEPPPKETFGEKHRVPHAQIGHRLKAL